jgi:hypothetical protein
LYRGGQTAVVVLAHDEQIGLLRGVHEYIDRFSFDEPAGDEPVVVFGASDRPVEDGGGADGVSLGSLPVGAASETRFGGPGVYEDELSSSVSYLGAGPGDGGEALVGAVDADNHPAGP